MNARFTYSNAFCGYAGAGMGLIKPLGGGGLGPSSGKRNIKAVREKSPWQEVGAQVF